MMTRSLAVAWIVFAASAVVHLLLLRGLKPRGLFRMSLWVVIGGVGACLWAASVAAGVDAPHALNSVLVFGSLWVVYLDFLFILQRSVSIRTLVEVTKAAPRPVSAGELERLYAERELFDRRLDTMLAAGYLQQRSDGLTLTPRGRRLARAIVFTRGVFGVRQYG